MENGIPSPMGPEALPGFGNAASDMGMLEVFGSQRLETIQGIIAKATGLALVTTDVSGEPVTAMTSFTPFCTAMRNGRESAGLCRTSDMYGVGQALVRQEKFVYFCPCGILEVAIPIIVRGKLLGGLFGGQVRCANAPEHIPRLARLYPDESARCLADPAMRAFGTGEKGLMLGIMLITVVIAMAPDLKAFPLEMAAVSGAIFLVLTGCISEQKAYRGVDWVTFFCSPG